MSRLNCRFGVKIATPENVVSGLLAPLDATLEQINVEKLYLFGKDLSENPCRQILVGELCSPLSEYLKEKML